jgi:hypothetical protein
MATALEANKAKHGSPHSEAPLILSLERFAL